MRVAILISGYLRSFKINIPNIKSRILDRFESVDVYLHITENENVEDKYFNNNRIEDISYIKNELRPVCLLTEHNHKLKNKHYENLLNTWVKFYKLNQIKKINEEIFGRYDLVIKYRPDIFLPNDFSFEKIEDSICIPKNTLVDKKKLNNKNDDFVCDILAFGKSNLMDLYFEFYKNIEKLSERYGHVSETLLKKYLDGFDIIYTEIDIDYSVILSNCNVFAIVGDSGSGKTTLGSILKKYFNNSFMLECDRYHKWERNDTKWMEYTHLNPEANFISKMDEDVFNLKIGKTIYQVDYDHTNGKFTDRQKIDSSDNIIVCGLHSLYTTNENIYNLKIFVDTDIKLRTLWKIRRDIKSRGHSYEHVINQIESRKNDYDKYILPQKDKSDMVVNFYSDDCIPIENIDGNIKLNVYVSKEFNIESVLIIFLQNNIEYKITDDGGKFYKFSFDKYSHISKSSFPIYGNFYDYVITIILKIRKKTILDM